MTPSAPPPAFCCLQAAFLCLAVPWVTPQGKWTHPACLCFRSCTVGGEGSGKGFLSLPRSL